jgi:HAD superfamily hydrolase (TIGR01509 family)
MPPSALRAATLKAVIFDLDGVIADSHPIHEQAWKLLLAEQGLDTDAIDLEFLYAGLPRTEILRHYLGPLEECDLQSLGRRKDELYRRSAGSVRAKPGLLRVLDELDGASIRFALATSAGRERTLETLLRFGIAGRFAAVVTGQDVRAPKPAPEMFLLVASTLAVTPRQVLVIEDSVAGVQAAQAAGMKCLAYVPAGSAAEFAATGVDGVISEFPLNAAEYFRRLFLPAARRGKKPRAGTVIMPSGKESDSAC